MDRFEYKTVTIKQKGTGLFRARRVPELENTLNREAGDGWRLREVVTPSGAFGESDKMILILERQSQPAT